MNWDTVNDSAHLAGILEVAGYIGMMKKGHLRYPEIRVQTGSPDVVRRLAKRFGGTSYRTANGWAWVVVGVGARNALERARPHLIGRHEKADRLIAWQPKERWKSKLKNVRLVSR